MRKILICGITGSIGQQALDCLENFKIVGFSFNNNIKLAKELHEKFPDAHIYSPSVMSLNTVNNFEELIKKTTPDLILNAIVGFDGIHITRIAIENNIDLALANKESLVVAGSIIQKYLKNSLSKIFPVDSEHSSLYELIHNSPKKIKKIYITASGGPFYKMDNPYSNDINFNKAINHPKWSMGYKISIDSATLINKAFEIIEAHYLYPDYEIEALYHPECYVHSMVEYIDNTIWMNVSEPNMKSSINLAINNFRPMNAKISSINFNKFQLSFDVIDTNKWLPIKWANQLINSNKNIIGLIMCVLDDYLIQLFKENIIKFNNIIEYINFFINKYDSYKINDWHDIYIWKNKLISECKILIEEKYGKN